MVLIRVLLLLRPPPPPKILFHSSHSLQWLIPMLLPRPSVTLTVCFSRHITRSWLIEVSSLESRIGLP